MNKRINRLLLLLPAMLIAGAVQAQTEAGDVPLGDVNNSGTVTVSDAQAIVAHLHGDTPTPFNAAVADLDGSGNISVTDVQIVISIIHHGSVDGQGTISGWTEGNSTSEQEPQEVTEDEGD